MISRHWIIIPEKDIAINDGNNKIVISTGASDINFIIENKLYKDYTELFKEVRGKFQDKADDATFTFSVKVGELKGDVPKKFLVIFLYDISGSVSGDFIIGMGGLESSDFGFRIEGIESIN